MCVLLLAFWGKMIALASFIFKTSWGCAFFCCSFLPWLLLYENRFAAYWVSVALEGKKGVVLVTAVVDLFWDTANQSSFPVLALTPTICWADNWFITKNVPCEYEISDQLFYESYLCNKTRYLWFVLLLLWKSLRLSSWRATVVLKFYVLLDLSLIFCALFNLFQTTYPTRWEKKSYNEVI